MKIACLVAGQPRFSKGFDTQLMNIKYPGMQIDWFFYLWENNYHHNNHVEIPDSLLSLNTEYARDYISNRLTADHRIADILCEPYPNLDHVHSKYGSGWPPPWIVYVQHYSLYRANELRKNYEKIHGDYDVVIRTRPELSLHTQLDFDRYKLIFEANPNIIVTPTNNRVQENFNDQFAIGSSHSINVYTDVVNYWDNMLKIGVWLNQEQLLRHHLINHNIEDQMLDFSVPLREYGSNDTGRFVADYGNWA